MKDWVKDSEPRSFEAGNKEFWKNEHPGIHTSSMSIENQVPKSQICDGNR